MATRKMEITPCKTYKTEANVEKAIAKVFGESKTVFRYFIRVHTDGRFFPVFVGQEALTHGVQLNFNVIA